MSDVKIQNVGGMPDILPEQMAIWQYLEHHIRQLMEAYGYTEIRTPILEHTELFKRSIGEATDIVEKEMYTFMDRDKRSLTLRPEGTASCVRAGIQHGLFYHQTQRLWYYGNMFRHEKAQKDRYRQFTQLGVEAFGFSGAEIDAEVILMSNRLWKMLGIENELVLHLNTLGSKETRKMYREKLVDYFSVHYDQLDEDSRRRLQLNPLRILDTKNPDLQELVENAPKLKDFLDDYSKQHFEKLCKILDMAGLNYTLDDRLVRGLDYYTHTVFEWMATEMGAQSALGGGGRYDLLVEQLGGHATKAMGFALGIERIVGLLEQRQPASILKDNVDAYFVTVGEVAQTQGLILAEMLHDEFPLLRLRVNCQPNDFKKQFKQADKSGAKLALILAEDELAAHKISIKYLREDKPQEIVDLSKLVPYLRKVLVKN
jgi:histidyl-tRNA synthetase